MTRTRKTGNVLLLTALVASLAATAAWAQSPDRISVFVKADDSTGFVEPDLRDSVRDIQREIPNRRNLRLVSKPEEATLMLVVVDRYISAGTPMTITLPGTTTTTATQIGSTVTATTTAMPPQVLSFPVGIYVVGAWMYIEPYETMKYFLVGLLTRLQARSEATGEPLNDNMVGGLVMAIGQQVQEEEALALKQEPVPLRPKAAPQTRPVVGTGAVWRGAARAITIDMEQWVAANREALK